MNSNNTDFYTSSGLSALINNHPIKTFTYFLGFLGLIFLDSRITSYGSKWLFGTFLFSIGGFFLTKKMFLRNRSKIIELTETLNKEIDDKAAILNKGKKGEDAVNAVIASLRNKMDFISLDKTWMPSDDGISDIVIDNGPNNASQEIDSLLVTEKNVFIIEVKDWKGDISFKNGINYFDGVERKSPEIQTKPKVEKLFRTINFDQKDISDKYKSVSETEIVPIYVFTHKDSTLDPNLPFNYVSLAALPSFFAVYRDTISKSSTSNIKLTISKIKEILDLSPDAKSNHMLKLSNQKMPPADATEFKRLHESIPVLQKRIEAIDNSINGKLKSPWLWVGVLLMSPFLGMVTLIMTRYMLTK